MVDEIVMKEDGLYWPSSDLHCLQWTSVEIDACDVIRTACSSTRTMITAGANVGAYALRYAKMFDTVYAIEPDDLNYRCLELNTEKAENIITIKAALGDSNKPINITRPDQTNCGSFFVDGEGDTTQIRIDDLFLSDLDLLHLDVEGYEMFALKGGITTIERCKPVIVLEWLDHGKNFGVESYDITSFLSKLGYTVKGKVSSDLVFVHH